MNTQKVVIYLYENGEGGAEGEGNEERGRRRSSEVKKKKEEGN